jgi:hypothetical protein
MPSKERHWLHLWNLHADMWNLNNSVANIEFNGRITNYRVIEEN